MHFRHNFTILWFLNVDRTPFHTDFFSAEISDCSGLHIKPTITSLLHETITTRIVTRTASSTGRLWQRSTAFFCASRRLHGNVARRSTTLVQCAGAEMTSAASRPSDSRHLSVNSVPVRLLCHRLPLRRFRRNYRLSQHIICKWYPRAATSQESTHLCRRISRRV